MGSKQFKLHSPAFQIDKLHVHVIEDGAKPFLGGFEGVHYLKTKDGNYVFVKDVSNDGKRIRYDISNWKNEKVGEGSYECSATDFYKLIGFDSNQDSVRVFADDDSYYEIAGNRVVVSDINKFGPKYVYTINGKNYFVDAVDEDGITLTEAIPNGLLPKRGETISLTADEFVEQFGESGTSFDSFGVGDANENVVSTGNVVTPTESTVTSTSQVGNEDSLNSKYSIDLILHHYVAPNDEQVLYVSNIKNDDVAKLSQVFDQYKEDKDKIVKWYEDGKKQLEISKEPFNNQTWLAEYSNVDTNIKSIETECINQADNSPEAINNIITQYNAKLLELKIGIRTNLIKTSARHYNHKEVPGTREFVDSSMAYEQDSSSDADWYKWVYNNTSDDSTEESDKQIERYKIYQFNTSGSSDYKYLEGAFQRAGLEPPYQVASIKDM